MASLTLRETTLGVVLSEKLLDAKKINFEFDMQLFYRQDDENFTLFSLGGKSRQGATIEAVYNPVSLNDDIILSLTNGKNFTLGSFPMKTWFNFKVSFDNNKLDITVNNKVFSFDAALLKKFAFGGLYVKPEWPQKMNMSQDIRLNLKSIKVY
jgi:hypothetical protein